MARADTIEKLLVLAQRNTTYLQFSFCLTGIGMLAVWGMYLYWLFTYETGVTLELHLLMTFCATLASILFIVCAVLIQSQINIVKKAMFEYEVRLDLQYGMKEAFGALIADITPGIRQSDNLLTVGADAIKDTRLITERASRLRAFVTKSAAEMGFASGLEELIKAAAAKEGIETDVKRLSTFVDESEKVVPLRRDE
ncbi:MAG: hypothetical protein ACI9SY_000182 [Candidatus Paceibacteria bacterium]|jgi:hypothetical protein